MSNINISTATINSPEYQEVWKLREEVLRLPLGLSLKNEDLSMDAEDVIFVAKNEGKVIGCLMLHQLNSATIKLRQMAVYDSWQGKDVGRNLVEAAEKYAASLGYKFVTLHARLVAEGFYSRLGYDKEGDIFTEVGVEHILMSKTVQ